MIPANDIREPVNTVRPPQKHIPRITKTAEAPKNLNRLQKRVRRTRKRLLEAALTLFCNKGVAGTSIQDITELADLGKGTFYRHFTSKEHLVTALAENAVARLLEHIGPPPSNQSLSESLEFLIQAHRSFFNESRNEFRLLFQGRLLVKLQQDFRTIDQPFVKYLGHIEKCITPFVPVPVENERTRRLVHAIITFISMEFSLAMISFSPEKINDILLPIRQSVITGFETFLIQKPDLPQPQVQANQQQQGKEIQ